MKNKKFILGIIFIIFTFVLAGCDESSIEKEQHQQEESQNQSVMQVGNPAIKNFREKKQVKDNYELRDQEGLVTYTYIVAQQTGQLILLGKSIGYPIPYATQFNNPSQITNRGGSNSHVLPQAEPNGLYIPANAEGTWVMLVDPNDGTPHVVYVEERVICSPFPLK